MKNLLKGQCQECGISINNSEEFCTYCKPYMKGQIKKEETMKTFTFGNAIKEYTQLINKAADYDELNRIDSAIRKDYYIGEDQRMYFEELMNLKALAISELEESVTVAVKKMEEEAEKWLEENKDLLTTEEESFTGIDVEGVFDEEGKLIARRFFPVDWQKEAEKSENDFMELKRFFGMDNPELWKGSRQRRVPVKREEGDRASVASIRLVGEVDPEGNFESLARIYNAGITCGTSHTDIWRDMLFEMGVNPNESYHSDLDVCTTENTARSMRKAQLLEAKELAAITEKDEVVHRLEADADELKEIVIKRVKEELEELFTEEMTETQAEKAVFENKIMFKVIEEAVYNARKEMYGEDFADMKNVLTKERLSKVHLYDYKLIVPVEDKEDETRSLNALFSIQVFNILKEIVQANTTQMTPAKEAFLNVQDSLRDALMDYSRSDVIKMIKRGYLVISKQDAALAYGYAKNSLTKGRFSKDEYVILKACGFIAVQRKRTITGPKKSETELGIAEEILNIIGDLRAEDFSSVNSSNAADVLEACVTIMKGTGKKAVEAKAYARLRRLAS